MAAIRSALEEACAPAAPDISDLLCCPITHVSARIASFAHAVAVAMAFHSILRHNDAQ